MMSKINNKLFMDIYKNTSYRLRSYVGKAIRNPLIRIQQQLLLAIQEELNEH